MLHSQGNFFTRLKLGRLALAGGVVGVAATAWLSTGAALPSLLSASQSPVPPTVVTGRTPAAIGSPSAGAAAVAPIAPLPNVDKIKSDANKQADKARKDAQSHLPDDDVTSPGDTPPTNGDDAEKQAIKNEADARKAAAESEEDAREEAADAEDDARDDAADAEDDARDDAADREDDARDDAPPRP